MLYEVRVVAKKIVSQFEIFISRSPFFRQRPGTKFVLIFPIACDARLPSFAFTRWLTQYKEREHDKQVLKIFFSISLLIRVPLILKVLRNLFKAFHLVDLDGSIWFRYQMIVRAQSKNRSLFFTE